MRCLKVSGVVFPLVIGRAVAAAAATIDAAATAPVH